MKCIIKLKKIKRSEYTILCLLSSRCFSAFAFSYSPFSKCRWSGLSLESVGGSLSLIRYQIPRIRHGYKKQLEMHTWKRKIRKSSWYIITTWSPGVNSFRVIANVVKLYRVRLRGGLFLFQSKVALDEGIRSFGLPVSSPVV